jgi:hypothetical protein
MKLLLPAISALLLSGCLGAATIVPFTIDPTQIYLGYPCRDQCAGFKIGYEQAKAESIQEDVACVSQNDAERLGCRAYVNDYRYATTQDMELIQDLEAMMKETNK